MRCVWKKQRILIKMFQHWGKPKQVCPTDWQVIELPYDSLQQFTQLEKFKASYELQAPAMLITEPTTRDP